MSKVTISPLLKSLFSRSDSITKTEAERLVEVLSECGDDTYRISLAQGTGKKFRGVNYLTIQARKDYDNDILVGLALGLEQEGWAVRQDVGGDRGNDGYWIFFNRNEGE